MSRSTRGVDFPLRRLQCGIVPMIEGKYCVLWEGSVLGPLAVADVKRMVLAGSADELLEIRRVGEQQWQAIGTLPEFEELFGARSRTRIKTDPETPISKRRWG